MGETKAAAYPLYPMTECPDERTAGVVLLEADDETKVTADRRGTSWRIVDWEKYDFDGEPHWFARSWFTITAAHLAALTRQEQSA
jgi:hypothetical protein